MRKNLLLAGLVVGLCSLGQAQSSNTKGQENTPATHEKSTGADQNRGQSSPGQAAAAGSEQASSLTGCLKRGSGSGNFTITGSDGKKHDIKSSSGSVKLDDHVGHRVTVKTDSESGGDRAKADSNRGAGQTAELNATSLTMVSTSCQ
jgi:hypothetical protein